MHNYQRSLKEPTAAAVLSTAADSTARQYSSNLGLNTAPYTNN